MTSSRFALLASALFCWAGLAANAQAPANATPVVFRMLALDGAISGLFYDVKGKPVPIYTDSSALSVIYQRPEKGNLSIYRQLPPEAPGKEPRRVPVASAIIGTEGPYLVLLTSAPSTDESQPQGTNVLTLQVLDDSWTVHPTQTFRVINTSKRTAAVQLNNKNIVLTSGQSQLFPSSGADSMVDFKLATLEGENWVLRVVSPQATIPRTRSTLLISDIKPTRENPNPIDVSLSNIFDTSQPPPPPKT